MRPAWLRFLCTGVIAYPALCTEYPRFRKIGDTAYRRERERERELSRPEAMVARCPEAALWNRWSPFMTAARVRVPNWRNVRSLALHRHGQSHVAEPFTVRSLNPELDADPLAGAPFCLSLIHIFGPVSTVLLASTLLDEPITTGQALGGVIVLVGVAIITVLR